MATCSMYRPASLSQIHSKNTNSATRKGEAAVVVVMVKAKVALTPRLAEGRMAAVAAVRRRLMEVVVVRRRLMEVVVKDIKAEGLRRTMAAAVEAWAGATAKVPGTKAEAAEVEVAKVTRVAVVAHRFRRTVEVVGTSPAIKSKAGAMADLPGSRCSPIAIPSMEKSRARPI